MGIYTKPARQMLIDLINEGNPDLPFAINTTDYEFTRPVAIETQPNGHNTEIRIMAKPGAPYIGNVLLTYRRLNLAYLFRNIVPTIKQWVPNGGNPTASNIRAYLHDFLPLFTKKYGINLQASQINNVALRERDGLDPNQYFNIVANPESLIYVGSTQAQWILGRRRLSELLQVDEVEGRLYPDGNDFSEDFERRPLLTELTHYIDFTMYHQENGINWDRYKNETFRQGYSGNWSNQVNQLRQENLYRDILNTLLMENYDFRLRIPSTSANDIHYRTLPNSNGEVGVAGIPYRVIALPHNDFPEANSEFFNSAVVIQIPDDCPWGIGNVFLHFNR